MRLRLDELGMQLPPQLRHRPAIVAAACGRRLEQVSAREGMGARPSAFVWETVGKADGG
eukprot:SAG11_NODE_9838_length_876_cov_25.258687_2_plen_59_part_00